jgi:signal transduction histidine kinase
MRLPTFEGERTLWPEISYQLEKLDLALSGLLASLRAGNTTYVEAVWDKEIKPTFDEIDGRLDDAIALNATGSKFAASDIVAAERDLRAFSVALNVFCALLAALTAFSAIRLFRQYTRITEAKIADLELFSGRVAHDLRGPLFSAGLAVQLARDKATEPGTKSLLARADRTLKRAGELVDGLLLLAQAVRVPDSGACNDVKGVLEDLIEELRPSARENQIELELGQTASLMVGCSAGVLANMVGNLVGNSIKYMGDAAVRHITVTAVERGNEVRIKVQDTGPGVPLAAQGKVFDVYTRAAPSGVSGLGLGLATVRRLAEVLGGQVGLESQGNSGSVFWIDLPRAQTAPAR